MCNMYKYEGKEKRYILSPNVTENEVKEYTESKENMITPRKNDLNFMLQILDFHKMMFPVPDFTDSFPVNYKIQIDGLSYLLHYSIASLINPTNI